MMFRNRAETESKNFARLREESISHVIVYEFLNPCFYSLGHTENGIF